MAFGKRNASATETPGKKISKHVLEMKFMQRFKSDESTVEDSKMLQSVDDKNQTTVLEVSWSTCENIKFPRFSFGGFNPAVEKLMDLSCNKRRKGIEISDGTEQVDVTLEEMAECRTDNSFVKTVGKKFRKSKSVQEPAAGANQIKKRPAFLKPKDWI